MDLGELKPEDLQVHEKTMHDPIAAGAGITDYYLDDSQTKVVERKTGFLRAFDKDLEQNIRKTRWKIFGSPPCGEAGSGRTRKKKRGRN